MHSRIKRANRDGSETGTKAVWIVAGIVTAAVFAAAAEVIAEDLSGAWLFLVVAAGALLGPLVAWLALFLYRILRPIPHWTAGMSAMDGVDLFTVETLHGTAPAPGTFELRLTPKHGDPGPWAPTTRKTFASSEFRTYLLPYPAEALGPPTPGEYTITFRGTPFGVPPTVLTSGHYEYVIGDDHHDNGWYMLRDD